MQEEYPLDKKTILTNVRAHYFDASIHFYLFQINRKSQGLFKIKIINLCKEVGFQQPLVGCPTALGHSGMK